MRTITASLFCWVSALLIPTLLVGCGSSVVSVPGEVVLDGRPVEKATVMLLPRSKGGLPARGTSDANGQFTLVTEKVGEGVMPGEYDVTVTRVEVSGLPTGPSRPVTGGSVVRTKWIVPEKYSNPKTAGISVEVKSGMEPLRLELSSR